MLVSQNPFLLTSKILVCNHLNDGEVYSVGNCTCEDGGKLFFYFSLAILVPAWDSFTRYFELRWLHANKDIGCQ